MVNVFRIIYQAKSRIEEANVNIDRWEFVEGDVSKHFNKWNYDEIYMIFIDGDHGKQFAQNYTKNVLPKMINQNKTVLIHNIFHTWKSEEQKVVHNFLVFNNIDWLSPSRILPTRKLYDSYRLKYWATQKIHCADMNPLIIINP